MTVSVALEVRSVVGRRGHYGGWRATAAAPAMLGSLALLLVLFGFLGRWEPVAILGWLVSGAVVFTRFGERVTVRTVMEFRPLTSRQSAALAGVWPAALAQAGYRADQIDLYVQPSALVNAYAAGGCSVAVSSGALREFLARRLSGDHMRAVLVHDLLTAPAASGSVWWRCGWRCRGGRPPGSRSGSVTGWPDGGSRWRCWASPWWLRSGSR